MRSITSWGTPLVGLVLGTIFFAPRMAYAQAVLPDANGSALAGVKSFNASVQVLAWLGVVGDQAQFERNAQTAFELGLRRDGIVVATSAPNFLFCYVSVVQSGGTVAYSLNVSYYSHELVGVHVLLWRKGMVARLGKNDFTAQKVAGDCVDKFSNEWLKQNPRQGVELTQHHP